MDNIALFHIGQEQISLLQIVLVAADIFIALFITGIGVRFLTRFGKKNNLSKKIARFIRQGIRVFVWFVALIVAFELLKIKYHQVLDYQLYSTDKLTLSVKNLLAILIIIYITRILVFVIEHLMDIRIQRKQLDKGRSKSIIQIVKYVIWLLGITIVISSLGFQVTVVIASVSALLVGIGFGLQNIFNDFFSGIIILLDGSIKVDDVVEVEGVVGRILDIGLRVSKVLTRDNVVIIVPNSMFTGEKVINWTHNEDVTRFHVNVGVAYGSDVRLVERILLEVADRSNQIVRSPKPFVRFNDFGNSSLDFQLYFWTANDFLVENIISDLRFDIDEQFRKNNVVIPFPQRDLHLKTKDF